MHQCRLPFCGSAAAGMLQGCQQCHVENISLYTHPCTPLNQKSSSKTSRVRDGKQVTQNWASRANSRSTAARGSSRVRTTNKNYRSAMVRSASQSPPVGHMRNFNAPLASHPKPLQDSTLSQNSPCRPSESRTQSTPPSTHRAPHCTAHTTSHPSLTQLLGRRPHSPSGPPCRRHSSPSTLPEPSAAASTSGVKKRRTSPYPSHAWWWEMCEALLTRACVGVAPTPNSRSLSARSGPPALLANRSRRPCARAASERQASRSGVPCRSRGPHSRAMVQWQWLNGFEGFSRNSKWSPYGWSLWGPGSAGRDGWTMLHAGLCGTPPE